MNVERLVDDLRNVASHSGSPLNLREALNKAIDGLITLWDENESLQNRINALEAEFPAQELPL